MTTWAGAPEPEPSKIDSVGWLRVILRGVPMVALVFGGLVTLLLLRLIERPIHGLHRPWTPKITRFVCRGALALMGLKLRVEGAPMEQPGAMVANHSSWLDIFVLNAKSDVYFVSKSEVAGWPGIGWLARATGTVFVRRDPREARAQKELFEARLLAGHRLVFFPEGTSSDGAQVLPFKSTLFAAFFAPQLHARLRIQPVSVSYAAPDGQANAFYGWWGDMDFGPHLIAMLAAKSHGAVTLTYHAPLKASDFASRKDLARASEIAVRAGHAPSVEARSMP
jgi:1-acyl-sn-glycerol-3-phosphate acyltransferase